MLRPIQSIFKSSDYPNLLVGLDSPDDAAIWKMDDNLGLVVTTDFFTPVVDDAYDYGAIAAANALSDVYAMGGKPFMALSIAALPPDLPVDVSARILLGGAEKAKEAGVVIAGGHTIQDKEPKFGLVVIGSVKPGEQLTKAGLQVGDKLVLTKPLGFGVTTTALKRELASEADVREVVGWMTKLNAGAGQLAREFHLLAGTDVTGFSLSGHGYEMAAASGVGLEIHYRQLPMLSCALEYARQWTFPGGAADNKLFFEKHVSYRGTFEEHESMLLFDPQTSGGLLLGVPPQQLDALLARAAELEQPVWEIGQVVAGHGICYVMD